MHLLNSVQFVFKYISSQLSILIFKVGLPNKHFKQWNCIINLKLRVTDGANINNSLLNHQTLWEKKSMDNNQINLLLPKQYDFHAFPQK